MNRNIGCRLFHLFLNKLRASLAIGVLYLAAQGLIYYIQFVTHIQEEEYNKKIRNNLASHYFKDNKYHKIAAVQNRMTNDLEMVRETNENISCKILY